MLEAFLPPSPSHTSHDAPLLKPAEKMLSRKYNFLLFILRFVGIWKGNRQLGILKLFISISLPPRELLNFPLKVSEGKILINCRQDRQGRVSPLSRHPLVPHHQAVDGVRDHREEGEAGYSDGDHDGQPQGVGGGGGGGDVRLGVDDCLGTV